jgi:hypothetical protein
MKDSSREGDHMEEENIHMLVGSNMKEIGKMDFGMVSEFSIMEPTTDMTGNGKKGISTDRELITTRTGINMKDGLLRTCVKEKEKCTMLMGTSTKEIGCMT